MKPPKRQYDVALSFAGEDREHARALAKELVKAKVQVFYDEYEQAFLWGSDLPAELHEIYYRDSSYVVMFISRSYVAKKWPNKERESAIARSLEDPAPYVLPVIIDEVEVPGLSNTLGHVPIAVGAQELCRLLLEKLGPARLKEWEASKPKYGGSDVDVLTSCLVTDLGETLKDQVDAKMKAGKLVEFPALVVDGIRIVPRLNRWPEDCDGHVLSAICPIYREEDGDAWLEDCFGTIIESISVRKKPTRTLVTVVHEFLEITVELDLTGLVRSCRCSSLCGA